MFETSVVRVRAAAAPRRVGLLTASIAFHSCVVVAAVVMTVSSVKLPEKAPNTMELFRSVTPPPPLGESRPPLPRPLPAQPPAPARPAPSTPAITAPPVVPDTITPAAPSTGTPSDASATTPTTGAGDGGTGSPIGVDGGVGAADSGIDVGPGTILRPGAGVTAPIVLHRVEPGYPQIAVKGRIEGIVIVECIIGKNGVCRDPQILRTPSPIFNQPAINAVQQWRFAPGTYRDQPVDTYFDLTIVFRLN